MPQHIFRPVLIQDLIAHATIIHQYAPKSSDESKIAISWLVQNRANSAAAYRKSYQKRHPQFGDGTLASACSLIIESTNADQIDANPAPQGQMDWEDVYFLRSVQAALMVWIGEISDNTNGATLFHSHRVHPKWAESLQPVALIGDFFFYSTKRMELPPPEQNTYPKYLH